MWTSDRRNLTPFICVQDYYNLLDSRIERELIPLCQSEGLGIMTYNATAVGLLTGHFRHSEPLPDGSVWAGNLQRFEQTMTLAADRVVETLVSITAERGRTPAQIAIAWILSRPGISSAMIGPDASAYVDENIGGVARQLADEEHRKLDEASVWAITDGQIV